MISLSTYDFVDFFKVNLAAVACISNMFKAYSPCSFNFNINSVTSEHIYKLFYPRWLFGNINAECCNQKNTPAYLLHKSICEGI